MIVIFEKELAETLKDKTTILELDTFMENGLTSPVTAFAVMAVEDIPLAEISNLENSTKLHNTMLFEYKNRRFEYCIQALEHLKGKWAGKLDTFYDVFEERILTLKTHELPDDWNGVVYKNH